MFRLSSCLRSQRAFVPLVRWYSEPVRTGRRAPGAYGISNMRSAPRLKNEFKNFLAYLSGRGFDRMPSTAYDFLKACGTRMVYETPEARTAVVKGIWTQLRSTGLVMETGLYNTLLQVYLLNEHKFVPSEIVEEMKESNVDPNQGTLALLLQAYCHQGNMAGATKMLEQMQSLEMPINEHVYAALITGHARSGDMKSAGELVGVMRENGINPGVVSYTALLCAYAEKGDMDGVRSVISEMRESRVFPHVPVYIKVMDTLSRCGHGMLITEVLGMVRNKQWMLGDLQDLVCQCAVRGEIESAMILIQCLTEIRSEKASQGMSFGPVMMRSMLSHGRPLEELLDVVHQLNEKQCGNHGHEELLHALLKGGNHGDVYRVLRDMHSLGLPIHTHYLYPVLAQCADRGDSAGLVECVRVLLELGLEPSNHVFHFWRKASGGFEPMLESIRASGLMESLVSKVVGYMCSCKYLEPLPGLIRATDRDHLDVGMVLNTIVYSVTSPSNGRHLVDKYAEIYASLNSLSPRPPLSGHVGVVVGHLVDLGETTLAMDFLDKLLNLGVHVEAEAYGKILTAYCKLNRAKDFFGVLRNMEAQNIALKAQQHRLILKLSAALGDSGRARNALAKLKIPDRNSYSNYIIALAKDGKLQLAVETLERMCRREEYPSYEAFYHVIATILQQGSLEDGLAMREEMHRCGYHSRYGIHFLFIDAYAQRGDVTGAQREFDEMLSKGISPTADTYTALMSAYNFHGSMEPIRDLMRGMEEHQVSLTRGMVSALLMAYVNSGDLTGAMSVMDEFTEQPPLMTSLLSLLGALVSADREAEVGKVVESLREMVGQATGSSQVDNMLLFTYLRAGKVDRAREIVLREGFEVDPRKLASFTRSESMKGKVESVRHAIELVRSLGVSGLSDGLSIALLRAYGRAKDTAGALQLKEDLEKARQHKLSDEFYSVLAESILQHSTEVPYVAASDKLAGDSTPSLLVSS